MAIRCILFDKDGTIIDSWRTWVPINRAAALYAASGGRVVTNPGGVLIRDPSGDVIGAVGISGDTADNDETCAIAGIRAAGLTDDPG